MRKGVVKWFDPERGYGIIKTEDDNQNVFVYIVGEAEGLDAGDRVEFEMVETIYGPRAGRVRRISSEG